ncbi:MAG TPA: rhomboid family intramembrane serine protease [Bacillota bacterium]|nr:rhomboid family intramembrane serine protease [Bacillota bacterium]HOR86309.1 rhomboid family intramembrane serine protease [Bacillota bacterium]
MNWLDILERRLGRFAIKNLMTYIVGITGIVFALSYFDREGLLIGKLILIPELVFRGEIWRLVTYIFIPPDTTILWILFVLYFYYMVGSALEHEWGSFKFNIFYFTGMIGTTIAAFITGYGATSLYLNLSLFLAFARIFPDYELFIFFVIPVKVKYLAMLNWAFIAYTVVIGNMSMRLTAIVSIINYFLFFGRDIFNYTKNNRQVYTNRRRFRSEIPRDFTFHRCTVCGKTEKDDPNMDFRYCPECEGDYEYCMDHVRNHEHVKK